MQKIIISVDHTDETGKYYNESYIKNQTIEIKDGETIHSAIVRVVSEEDYCTFLYKGKPRGNVYRDKKDGSSYIVGYHYRTKHSIDNHDNVPFTTWVTIHGQVNDIELSDIETI